MENEFKSLKTMFAGTWKGEGFAKFPTITDTGYTEILRFEPDNDKTVIGYSQKTWYKNETPNNGKTVFWDTGFILLKEDRILLVSAQSGGRTETYELDGFDRHRLVFNSQLITNDPKTIRSQRVISISGNRLDYELNMSTHQAADFQNHLKASLVKSE
jgi:hypothetical protein